MKISGVLTERGPHSPTGGALSIWCHEVYPRMNHDVTIYSVDTNKKYRDQNIVYICPGWTHTLAKKTDEYISLFKLERSLFARTVSKHISKDTNISEHIIHIHNRPRFVPILHKNHPNAKILLHLQNDHLINVSKSKGEKIVSQADAIIGISQYIVEGIREKYQDAENKSHLVYNGVNVDKFKPIKNNRFKHHNSRNWPKILFVGRICEDKGVHLLIQAMKYVIKEYENAVLTIVGASWFDKELNSNYYKYLRNISSGIQNNIEFTGYIPHKEVPKIYRSSDICVIPSVWKEPFGLVVAESMASGLPTIVTERGGPPEIVGEAGIVINPENIKRMANEILDLLDNPTRMRKLGEAARARAEVQFSWDRTATQFEKVLSEI